MSDRSAGRADLEHLRDFVRTRGGVEAYVEPPTSVTQTTLLLVAGDGEWTRRRIASAKAAGAFARSMHIPVYDTNRVGYPQRMRDYDLRQRSGAGSRPTARPVARPAAPPAPSPAETAALMTLERVAGVDPLPDRPSREDLLGVWRQARARAHPDRAGGDRTEWDRVEEAARTLGLDG